MQRLFIMGITERKQAHAEIHQVFERSLVGIFRTDFSGKIILANPATLRIMGYDSVDAMNEVGLPNIYEDPSEWERLMEWVEQGPVEAFETRVVRADGEIIDIILTIYPVLGDDGQLRFLEGNLIDITERKQAEEALRESEERYLSLAEASFEGLLIHDRGRIIDANTRFQEMFGYPLEELIGMSAFELVAPKDRETVQQNVAGGKEEPYEAVGLRKDATTFPMEIQVRHMQYRGARVRVAACQDITERKKIEQEREKMLAELEGKNAELERFTYTVSHDLKSPMVTIKGFLGMLRVDARSGNLERMEKDIQYIETATDKMQRLLGELLELSRIGRLMNPPEAVSLTNVAEEAVEMVAGQIAARGVNVEVAPEMPVVHGDRVRLVEVFQNLIDNAVKFIGDQQRPRVEIGATKENGEILCYVRDNGIGIDSRYHEKVFGLFERLDAKSEGTGIGLVLVKRIVEVHGGRIWVESQGEGQGSTFWFTLPEDGASIPPAT